MRRIAEMEDVLIKILKLHEEAKKKEKYLVSELKE